MLLTEQLNREHLSENHVDVFCHRSHHSQPDDHQMDRQVNCTLGIEFPLTPFVTTANTGDITCTPSQKDGDLEL